MSAAGNLGPRPHPLGCIARPGPVRRSGAAGVDIKVVSELLGHSGTAITRDIYTSAYGEIKRSAAQAIAAAIIQAGANLPGPQQADRAAA